MPNATLPEHTHCWRCNTRYPMAHDKCPACSHGNADADLNAGIDEMFADGTIKDGRLFPLDPQEEQRNDN
jgi:hypothetical protein